MFVSLQLRSYISKKHQNNKGVKLKFFNPTTQERIELVFLLWEIGTPKEKIINAFRKASGFDEKIFRTQLDYLFEKWENLRRE